MFAPKRTGKDRALLGKVDDWLTSEQWKLDVQARVSDWSRELLGLETTVTAKDLDLTLLYADVDSKAGLVTIDGTMDAEIRTSREVVQTWRLPVTLELRFGSGTGPQEHGPAVEWMWIDSRALAPRPSEVAAE